MHGELQRPSAARAADLLWLLALVGTTAIGGSSGGLNPADTDPERDIAGLQSAGFFSDIDWSVRVNGWAPSVTGTVGVQGINQDINLPIERILREQLDMTFQVAVEAQKGRWGFAADLFYVEISGGIGKDPTTMISSVELDIEDTIAHANVFYRAFEWGEGRGFLDFGVGARWYDLDMSLRLQRDPTGVNQFSSRFASRVVDVAGDQVTRAVTDFVRQDLAPALRDAAAERIRDAAQDLAGELQDDLQTGLRNAVLGELGNQLADRLANQGPIRDALSGLIAAAANERIAAAERAFADAKQSAIDAKASATAAAKEAARKAAEAAQRAEDAARQARQRAESTLAQRLERGITENWQENASASKTWVDPVVGFRMRHWIAPRWFVNLYGDVGGFGIGSRFSWAASAGLGYRATDKLKLESYYRAYAVDYEDDGFVYDTTLHGLFFGLAYTF
jgi:hypothetical protein